MNSEPLCVLVIDLENPNGDMLEAVFQLSRSVKRPTAMFVDRSDRASIEARGTQAYRSISSTG